MKLVPAQYVKAYVKRSKNDGRDAEAGCEAMSRPTMRFVPAKSAETQAGLMVASMRERLTRERTRLANTIRGHGAEFGLTAPKGLAHIAPLLAEAAGAEAVPELARELFAALAREWDRLGDELKQAEAKLMAWHKTDETSRRLAQIPSLGPIGASMLVMKVPDPKVFKSARHFAAWIGLTPKDHSTAGKQRLGAITKAGDEALRSVLVVGATAVIKPVVKGAGLRSPWLLKLLEKHEPKLVAVALANRVARIAWKMMVTGEAYDPQAADAQAARNLTQSPRPDLGDAGTCKTRRGGAVDRSQARDTPSDPTGHQARVLEWNSRRANHLGEGPT